MIRRLPIYLEVKVEIEFDDKFQTSEDAIQEAVSNFDYDFKLESSSNDMERNIKVVDTEIQEIMDATYDNDASMEDEILIPTIDGNVKCSKRFDGVNEFFDCYLNEDTYLGEVYGITTKEELEKYILDNFI